MIASVVSSSGATAASEVLFDETGSVVAPAVTTAVLTISPSSVVHDESTVPESESTCAGPTSICVPV